MKYAIEMGSCTVIYTSSFMEIGSDILKLLGRGFTIIQHGDLISLLLYLKMKKVGS
jgi:hypothetical protein